MDKLGIQSIDHIVMQALDLLQRLSSTLKFLG